MKKLFLMLIAAAVGTLSVFAQNSLVATLQHGSNIQAFYGDDALSSAHTAAVDGDIITLSTGSFNSCNITKAITLRGEGIGKTKLKSNITFTIPHGSACSLKLEGLELWNINIYVYGTDGTEKAILSKCLWGSPYAGVSGPCFYNCNATIVQCRTMGRGSVYAGENSNITCLNSEFNQISSYYDLGRFDIQNCILEGISNSIMNSSIKNCIVSGTTSLDASNISSHCLVKNGSGYANSWDVDSWDSIIEGGWDMNGTCHLTETAAAIYLGTDGTQVGIYGGMYPYDETVSYPLVKTFDVIGSHKNGKLNVKINVE